MDRRRHLVKLASAIALPAAAVALSNSEERGDENPERILGAWSTLHTLPFPPGSFREFLSFSDGGVFHETNSFLHTASNLDLSAFGLPAVLNASDGVGNWVRSRQGLIQVVFRKMLFDGAHVNFGDLRVTGTLHISGVMLHADWRIQAVDAANTVIADFGTATSEGTRLA